MIFPTPPFFTLFYFCSFCCFTQTQPFDLLSIIAFFISPCRPRSPHIVLEKSNIYFFIFISKGIYSSDAEGGGSMLHLARVYMYIKRMRAYRKPHHLWAAYTCTYMAYKQAELFEQNHFSVPFFSPIFQKHFSKHVWMVHTLRMSLCVFATLQCTCF